MCWPILRRVPRSTPPPKCWNAPFLRSTWRLFAAATGICGCISTRISWQLTTPGCARTVACTTRPPRSCKLRSHWWHSCCGNASISPWLSPMMTWCFSIPRRVLEPIPWRPCSTDWHWCQANTARAPGVAALRPSAARGPPSCTPGGRGRRRGLGGDAPNRRPAPREVAVARHAQQRIDRQLRDFGAKVAAGRVVLGYGAVAGHQSWPSAAARMARNSASSSALTALATVSAEPSRATRLPRRHCSR